MLNVVKDYKILIIDEIFMISDELFEFLSDMFVRVRENTLSFDDIHVVIFENLMQLFSIIDRQIFHVSQ